MVAEHDVLGDGERLDEPEVLVHHPDTGVERVARRVELDRLPVQLELALVGAVEAREDVRQRALAGAVLAEQRVNLADARLEVDARRWRRRPGKRFVMPRIATADPQGERRADGRLASSSWLRPQTREWAPVQPALAPCRPSALRAALDALDQPVDREDLRQGHPLALRDAELARLVVDRALELVERARR